MGFIYAILTKRRINYGCKKKVRDKMNKMCYNDYVY